MTADELFPPTQAERLAAVAAFLGDERRQRIHMLTRHPEQDAYWTKRIAQCDAAIEHVAALTKECTP